MRLWSIHPSYLDPKGLVALWREVLLAQAVLQGKTRGYLKHPQLIRFRAHAAPLIAINAYLWSVHQEACLRGYSFDASKLTPQQFCPKIPVTQDQIDFEWQHFLAKIANRDPSRFQMFCKVVSPICNPIFFQCDGPIEPWERGKKITFI